VPLRLTTFAIDPRDGRAVAVFGDDAGRHLPVWVDDTDAAQLADAARGDRTLAATHGAVGALRAARLCLALAGVPVVMGALWGLFPRVVLVGAALLPWADAPLRAWQRAAEPGDPAAGPARALVYLRRLGRLCLACLGCALIDYLWDDLHGRALAGRGTAWTPTLPVEEAP